jgi:hypothetical protein
MQSQRSLAWLILASTLILGVCWLLTLPLSAAPPERPRNTPTGTRATTPTGTSSGTSTEAPKPTGTPTPTLGPKPAAVSTGAAMVAVGPNPNQIYINEFLPQPASDWNGDGVANTEDEWIELFNSGEFVVDLGGWKLDDVSGGGSAPYTIPTGAVIPARGFRLFFHAETNLALNDTGDDVQLLHADGTTADAISYSSSSPDRSYGRFPDGATYFTDY